MKHRGSGANPSSGQGRWREKLGKESRRTANTESRCFNSGLERGHHVRRGGDAASEGAVASNVCLVRPRRADGELV